MPIVYASDAFLRLTGIESNKSGNLVYVVGYLYQLYTFVGYARHEVLGRNCRFLSGVDTESLSLNRVSILCIIILVM